MEFIFLDKNEVLGFLDKINVDICKNMTGTYSEPLTLDVSLERPEETLCEMSKFIWSPTDTTVYLKSVYR